MADNIRTAIRKNTLAALVNALAVAAPGAASAEIVASHARVATLTDRYWTGGSSQSVLELLHVEEEQLEELVLDLTAEIVA